MQPVPPCERRVTKKWLNMPFQGPLVHCCNCSKAARPILFERWNNVWSTRQRRGKRKVFSTLKNAAQYQHSDTVPDTQPFSLSTFQIARSLSLQRSPSQQTLRILLTRLNWTFIFNLTHVGVTRPRGGRVPPSGPSHLGVENDSSVITCVVACPERSEEWLCRNPN